MKITQAMIEKLQAGTGYGGDLSADDALRGLEAVLSMPEVREALLAEQPATEYVTEEPMEEGAEVRDADDTLWVRNRYGWHIGPIGTNAGAAWDYVMKYAPVRRIR